MPSIQEQIQETLRNEMVHLIVALLGSIIIFLISQNLILSLITLLSGMLVDIDHMFDYSLYMIRNRKGFNLSAFLSGSYLKDTGKFYAPLHSWELVIFLTCLSKYFNNYIFASLAFGLTIHFIVDYLTNKVNWKAYFIFYRIIYKFDKSCIRK